MSAETALSIKSGPEDAETMASLAYSKTKENLGRALELAGAAGWLWGPHASLEDYVEGIDPLEHRITGELTPLLQPGYRDGEYYACFNPVEKEFYDDFAAKICKEAQNYLVLALDADISREERLVILDFAKQYVLTSFHAIQYPLRTDTLNDEDISKVDMVAEAARRITRAFYLDILGHDAKMIHHEAGLAADIMSQPSVVDFISKAAKSHFKMQELDQPLTVLAASLLAAESYPAVDSIYALPAGGTQHAIVTQLLYEMKDPNRVPSLEYLPISTHSARKEPIDGALPPSIDFLIGRSNPSGKRVLVCEDNTNTGTTLNLAADVLTAASVRECHISVVELDPTRVLIKTRDLPDGEKAPIANYAHPLADTSIDIVPVTHNSDPDVQRRKICALATIANNARDTIAESYDPGYENLDERLFDVVHDLYIQALRYCGDVHGYRNPSMVAAYLLHGLVGQGLMLTPSPDVLADQVAKITAAATRYPYLPDDVKLALERGESSLDFDVNGPWMRSGALEVMSSMVKCATDTDSMSYIWTKGDTGPLLYPPFLGSHEQQMRFTISGLEALMTNEGLMPSDHFQFLAHPEKARMLKTQIFPHLRRAKPNITSVVIVDDSEKNLAEAAQAARYFNLRPYIINPLDTKTDRVALLDLATKISMGNWGSGVAFFCDMDDVLLHERFRKYHQPRNIALELQHLR